MLSWHVLCMVTTEIDMATTKSSIKKVVKETGFCHKEIDAALYVRRTPVGIGGTKERKHSGCRVYDQCLGIETVSSVRQEEGGGGIE